MKKKNKEDIKFKIEQLKKNSTYMILLSIALTFIIELSYVLLTIIIGGYSRITAIIGIIIAAGFFIFAVSFGISNFLKIKKLEQELHKK